MILIPFTNPVRFKGVDPFDFDYYAKSCKYLQKWQSGDVIFLQFLADEPVTIKVVDNSTKITVKTVSAIIMETSLIDQDFDVYEAQIDLDDLDFGCYYLQISNQENDTVISHAFDYQQEWPETILINYTNSENDFDTIFDTGLEFMIRVEGVIHNFAPKTDSEVYFSQRKNPVQLFANPYRQFTLQVGRAKGVAEWIADILNIAFACDQKSINGVKFERNEGADWEVIRVDNYSLIGLAIDIVPKENKTSGVVKGFYILGDTDQNAISSNGFIEIN